MYYVVPKIQSTQVYKIEIDMSIVNVRLINPWQVCFSFQFLNPLCNMVTAIFFVSNHHIYSSIHLCIFINWIGNIQAETPC